MKNNIIKVSLLSLGLLSITACNDYLDRIPESNILPEQYYNTEDALAAATISLYNFPTNGGWNIGTFSFDNGTDNQATVRASKWWLPGEVHVPSSGGAWSFGDIRDVNYFFDQVMPKYKKGEIIGNDANIKHFIGEAYFLRAYRYFNKLKALGDFPIITKTYKDNKDELVEISKRQPRNEVARFILSDLDKAIEMMKSGKVEGGNRLSKEAALLFKSRVALYEASWLKYHAGTARVPGGPGWPGAKFHPNFQYKAGSIKAESDYFYEQAMGAAKQIADNITLVESTHPQAGTKESLENPYFTMFSDINMTPYSEVIFWRQYNDKYVSHHTMHYLTGGGSSGYTRNFVETFVMKNGLPIYAGGSGYQGDGTLSKVRADRDERLQYFMAIPGDLLVYEGVSEPKIAAMPDILALEEERAVTGYNVKKGLMGNGGDYIVKKGTESGSIVFRATEAYLNYIEASYEKNGNLNADALNYWKAIRRRAGLPEDPNVTINATDLSKEKDLAKYSAGNVLTDKTLYNIRRERRCEFIAEGMRWDDLKRWRSLDQLKTKPYIVEGFRLWSDKPYLEGKKMSEMYVIKEDNGSTKTALRALPEKNPNVSAKTQSEYLRPYQIVQANNQWYNGYKWIQAHYLNPIAHDHFVNASTDHTVAGSVIYQNPGWPATADGLPSMD
ncbi:RagB/SusD family nutrient uptake outer membrane protein [Ornithobacterium rhinotracheale]|uniref:RagB/SusD family nutrient uptake outer membrane protein n=1 Tax=Ornithobacterium rhinotracheale TaxID=28251 RepID=UPI00129CECE2|nr:RagB/SusD family nutrient uptake outer membrane protein [Ornithobacterium rhinotracheale]MRJ08355.1 RagB/SusD family nutrient uptake outer membrane protein [Ornithobacterium rhinotracheale]UOH77549.1 RagB/SusD family nutrient uptake outer membrane protein [Ornithobacterium rhinotracheale]